MIEIKIKILSLIGTRDSKLTDMARFQYPEEVEEVT